MENGHFDIDALLNALKIPMNGYCDTNGDWPLDGISMKNFAIFLENSIESLLLT